MPVPRHQLEPGRVLRTGHLARWTSNPTRLAARLVAEGTLVRLRHGLYAVVDTGRFGPVPPSDDALLDAFVGPGQWLETGPPRWNALGLGATALFVSPLIYNTRRSGVFDLGGRPFTLRRVRFPRKPPVEWFVVDLMMNADRAGVSRTSVSEALARAIGAGRFSGQLLQDLASTYATKDVQRDIERASR